jgi:hypothetical protein
MKHLGLNNWWPGRDSNRLSPEKAAKSGAWPRHTPAAYLQQDVQRPGRVAETAPGDGTRGGTSTNVYQPVVNGLLPSRIIIHSGLPILVNSKLVFCTFWYDWKTCPVILQPSFVVLNDSHFEEFCLLGYNSVWSVFNRYYSGTCYLHLQGRRMSQARNQHEAGCKLGLFFDPENGGEMSLLNIEWFSTGYTALYSRRYNSS